MSYRTIVVHLDDRLRCAARVSLAIGLAARHGSRLLGIAPTGLPDVIVTLNSAVPDGIECIALSAAHLRGKAEEVARAFDAQCRAAGVASFESRVVVDEAVDAIVRLGSCSDLVVIGQSDRSDPVAGVAFDFPQQVLLNAGVPVLMVPSGGSFATLGEHVLIAWKGTREAARAVRDALPLLRAAGRVSLVEVAEAEPDTTGDGTLADAAAWLRSHHVAVEASREPAQGGIGEQLQQWAAERRVDLLVSGGYGHSRLREWVLGGATRHLLDHMTLPTLLSH